SPDPQWNRKEGCPQETPHQSQEGAVDASAIIRFSPPLNERSFPCVNEVNPARGRADGRHGTSRPVLPTGRRAGVFLSGWRGNPSLPLPTECVGRRDYWRVDSVDVPLPKDKSPPHDRR